MARIAGVFYAMQVAFGPGMYVARKLFVAGDAAKTATNILAHTTLFQLGFAGNLIALSAYIVVTALFYELFRPVNRTVSLLAAFFSLTGCVVIAVGCVFYISPLFVLGGAHAASAFTGAQLQGGALTLFKLYGQSFNLSFVFFGFYCLLIGSLILRSTFLPRILGAGMLLAGLSWLTFLWPPLSLALLPYILLGGIGEMALTVWLLAAGVNSERWNEQDAAAGRQLRAA